MTEEDLIDLGFEKVDIYNVDSQNGYDYYYYQKILCEEVSLYTTDSIDVVNNSWEVKCWDIPAVKIVTMLHYTEFVNVLNNIIC